MSNVLLRKERLLIKLLKTNLRARGNVSFEDFAQTKTLVIFWIQNDILYLVIHFKSAY